MICQHLCAWDMLTSFFQAVQMDTTDVHEWLLVGTPFPHTPGKERGEHSHLIKFDVHAHSFPAKSAPATPKGGPRVIHHTLIVCDIQSQRLPIAHINPSIRLHDG